MPLTLHSSPLPTYSLCQPLITQSCALLPQALLFRALCFVASVLGLVCNPFFFALHLLDLVWSSTSLQNVLKSVMLNYKQVRPQGIPFLLYLVTLQHVCEDMSQVELQVGEGQGESPTTVFQCITSDIFGPRMGRVEGVHHSVLGWGG